MSSQNNYQYVCRCNDMFHFCINVQIHAPPSNRILRLQALTFVYKDAYMLYLSPTYD